MPGGVSPTVPRYTFARNWRTRTDEKSVSQGAAKCVIRLACAPMFQSGIVAPRPPRRAQTTVQKAQGSLFVQQKKMQSLAAKTEIDGFNEVLLPSVDDAHSWHPLLNPKDQALNPASQQMGAIKHHPPPSPQVSGSAE